MESGSLDFAATGYSDPPRLLMADNRGGQGVISIKTSERNGLMVASTLVDNNDGIMLISDKGTMIRTSAEQIPSISRNTQGVKIITPKEGEKILECVRIDPEEEEE